MVMMMKRRLASVLLCAGILGGAAALLGLATPGSAQRAELLAVGTKAPDFTVEAPGGGPAKLSDYKGKIVVLDFWATWCPPCQKSMPHLEQVWKAVKEQNVAVFAVCIADTKEAYEKWTGEKKETFTFPTAFDPAGRSPENVGGKLYNVRGIPTTYVLDKDGKVAAAFTGYSDGDKRLEEALKKLGVKLPE